MSKVEIANLQEELEKAEENLVKAKEKLAGLRRQLPKEEVTDYALKDWNENEAKLSSFFGEKKDLILIHNMGTGCVYCTM